MFTIQPRSRLCQLLLIKILLLEGEPERPHGQSPNHQHHSLWPAADFITDLCTFHTTTTGHQAETTPG